MMMTLIEEKHRTWLKEHLNLTFEEVEAMSDEEDSKLCNALLMAECDALEDDTEDLSSINEIQDIIYGDREPSLEGAGSDNG